MKKFKIFFSLIVLIALMGITSCKKDDAPTFGVAGNQITGDYSGDGTLSFAFSTDNGTTWSNVAPTGLVSGSKVKIKITDGLNDLTANDFEFLWSSTSGNFTSTTSDIAELTISDGEVSVSVNIIEIMDLVIVNRTTGKLYTVNKANGDTTYAKTMVNSLGNPISGLRALEYDPTTGKGYLGSTNSDGGKFYSFVFSTGTATVLNENLNEASRDGISGLLLSGDSLIANIYSNVVYNSALVRFGKNSGNEGSHLIIKNQTTDGWSTGGIIYGSSTNELILGGENQIYFANLSGLISDTTELVPTTNISAYMLVMDLARDKKTGEVYSLINDYDNTEYLFLAKINTTTGVITEIKQMADATKSKWVHCLEFIPRHRLK